jgi:glucokinase
MILSGDIGGTKTNLAIFEPLKRRLKLVYFESYLSREHANLEEIVAQFMSRCGLEVELACFGIAGPVKQGRSETTNLAWVVDARSLARKLRLDFVGLINDLEANAWGIAALGDEDFFVLHQGHPEKSGNAAVISAGTGLGEAGLCWNGPGHRPFASEGGHCDFAPTNALQTELLGYLSAEFGHVSNERVVSGPGLHNLYRFLRDTDRAEEPAWLAEQLRAGDPSAAISNLAMEGKSALCIQALDLFVELYGAVAGNLALKFMATAGVFLGGGIAPKIATKLQGPLFRSAFVAKGRLQPLLEAIPVKIILNDKAALIGAAAWTWRDEIRSKVRPTAKRRDVKTSSRHSRR